MIRAHAGLVPSNAPERVEALSEMVREEEEHFTRVLSAGLRQLARIPADDRGMVDGAEVFALLADRGFPPDLASEVLAGRGMAIDWHSFDAARERHRAVSRASQKRRFGSDQHAI